MLWLLVWSLSAAVAAHDTGVLGAFGSYPRSSEAANEYQSRGIAAGQAGDAEAAYDNFFCAAVLWPIGAAGATHFANFGVSLMRRGLYPEALEVRAWRHAHPAGAGHLEDHQPSEQGLPAPILVRQCRWVDRAADGAV